ncbi:hypothetical protein PCH70_30660 [Pseudomonas cichorii JBC1]|nr:hypothetical protein PCH70_30660 [Pseudomonas cichorii JBC1]
MPIHPKGMRRLEYEVTTQTHKGHPKVAFVEASIRQPKLTS